MVDKAWFDMVSKLPMRQLTDFEYVLSPIQFSKLPMRQLTTSAILSKLPVFSKLPMRQLTLGKPQKK